MPLRASTVFAGRSCSRAITPVFSSMVSAESTSTVTMPARRDSAPRDVSWSLDFRVYPPVFRPRSAALPSSDQQHTPLQRKKQSSFENLKKIVMFLIPPISPAQEGTPDADLSAPGCSVMPLFEPLRLFPLPQTPFCRQNLWSAAIRR